MTEDKHPAIPKLDDLKGLVRLATDGRVYTACDYTEDKNAKYVLLRIDNDLSARTALKSYAYLIETKEKVMAQDITELLNIIERTLEKKKDEEIQTE